MTPHPAGRTRSPSPSSLPEVRRATARDDRGSATAEFAVVVPAIVLVVALGAGALTSSARAVRLQDAAAAAARLLGRAETTDAAAAALAGIAPGATMEVEHGDSLVCVTAAEASGLPFLPALHARSCALDGGR